MFEIVHFHNNLMCHAIDMNSNGDWKRFRDMDTEIDTEIDTEMDTEINEIKVSVQRAEQIRAAGN